MNKCFFIKDLPYRFFILGLIFFLASCTLRGFKPPPGPEDSFKIPNQNTSKSQTIHALDACGYYSWKPLPPSVDRQEKLKKIQEDIYHCMKLKGFVWIE